jgi:alpha-tubulin suppressor-like RCC1 family protein
MRRSTILLVVTLALGATLGVTAPVSAAPTRETNLVTIRGIALGQQHTCAVLTNGQVRCWGGNGVGQLGTGNTNPSLSPVTVRNSTDTGPLTGVTAVVTGAKHTCALLATRQVQCWGDNTNGQMGAGSVGGTEDLPVVVRNPASTGPLTAVSQISAQGADGTHTCATLTSGQARCWGGNGSGQLGNGTTGADNGLPVAVVALTGPGALTGVAEVAAGGIHSCARLTSGQARCWGGGQLGDGSFNPSDRPVVVRRTTGTGALTGVLDIATGSNNSCARVTGNQARCWGSNAVGDGTPLGAPLPQAVQSIGGDANLKNVGSVSAGAVSACAVLTNRQLRCWGLNTGDGAQENRRLPTAVLNVPGTAAIGNVTMVAQTGGSACLVLTNGQARCWGDNGAGQLGDGSNAGPRLIPVVVRT